MTRLKLTIGSVTARQSPGISQSSSALQRSLEASLVHDLAQIRITGSREANVVQARIPAAHTTSGMAAAISQAIAKAVRKGR